MFYYIYFKWWHVNLSFCELINSCLQNSWYFKPLIIYFVNNNINHAFYKFTNFAPLFSYYRCSTPQAPCFESRSRSSGDSDIYCSQYSWKVPGKRNELLWNCCNCGCGCICYFIDSGLYRGIFLSEEHFQKVSEGI